METKSKDKKKRGCLKKVLVFFVLPGSVVMIAILIWAGVTFVYWGPDLTERDFVVEMQEWSATQSGGEVDDHRFEEAVVVLHETLIEVDTAVLGEPEFPRSKWVHQQVFRTKMWKRHWPRILRHGDSPEDYTKWAHWRGYTDETAEGLVAAEHALEAIEKSEYDTLLLEALELPGYIPTEHLGSPWPMVRGDPLNAVNYAASIERLRCHRAINSGDANLLLTSVGRLVRLHQLASMHPTMIGQMVAWGVGGHTADASIDAAMHGGFDRDVLERLDGLLGDIVPADAHATIELERLRGLGALQSTMQVGVTLKRRSYAHQTAALNEIYNEIVDFIELTPKEQRHTSLKLENRFVGIDAYNNMPAMLATPPLGVIVAGAKQLAIDVRGARLILAVERHSILHGELPADLAAIQPSLLPSNIDDSYRPEEPLQYVRYDEPDRFGREYVVYSVGTISKMMGGCTMLLIGALASRSRST